MVGRLLNSERYHTVLIYTQDGKAIIYETLMMTDKDLERFRARASKNEALEIPKPKPLLAVVWAWLASWFRRKV